MLTKDRNTPFKDAAALPVPVAAGVLIHAGAMVVANASGYGAPGSTAANLVYLGRAEDAVDNTAGADGSAVVVVRRKLAFKWKNSPADPITPADLGKTAWIVDDETVAKTNGGGARSACGKIVQIEPDGIWVE